MGVGSKLVRGSDFVLFAAAELTLFKFEKRTHLNQVIMVSPQSNSWLRIGQDWPANSNNRILTDPAFNLPNRVVPPSHDELQMCNWLQKCLWEKRQPHISPAFVRHIRRTYHQETSEPPHTRPAAAGRFRSTKAASIFWTVDSIQWKDLGAVITST